MRAATAYRLWTTLLLGALLPSLVWLPPAAARAAQDEIAPSAPSVRHFGEAYRLRIENEPLGRIEISTDEGRHYLLIGRVLHPAAGFMEDATARIAGVERAGGWGLQLSLGAGRALSLLPAGVGLPAQPTGAARGKRKQTAGVASIATNLKAREGIFGTLLPASGSSLQLQKEHEQLVAPPTNQPPGENDRLVLLAGLAADSGRSASGESDTDRKRDVEMRVADLARSYAESAPARARAEGRMVVSGTLMLRARLPEGEPVPISAVLYAIDDKAIAAQNVPPFEYVWDTRQATDGEHVVEIRGVDGEGNVITKVRSLVVVNNAGSGGARGG